MQYATVEGIGSGYMTAMQCIVGPSGTRYKVHAVGKCTTALEARH